MGYSAYSLKKLTAATYTHVSLLHDNPQDSKSNVQRYLPFYFKSLHLQKMGDNQNIRFSFRMWGCVTGMERGR